MLKTGSLTYSDLWDMWEVLGELLPYFKQQQSTDQIYLALRLGIINAREARFMLDSQGE